MATYQKCGEDVSGMVDGLILAHHDDLQKAAVSVECLYAYAPRSAATGEPTGPAIKFAGWPAAAIVRINSIKDRVEGKADATIIIDGDTWKDRPEPEKLALLDHELTALEVQRDKTGNVKLDDSCRPKLKKCLADWRCEGFVSVARRHKDASLEVQQARQMAKDFGGYLFSMG